MRTEANERRLLIIALNDRRSRPPYTLYVIYPAESPTRSIPFDPRTCFPTNSHVVSVVAFFTSPFLSQSPPVPSIVVSPS